MALTDEYNGMAICNLNVVDNSLAYGPFLSAWLWIIQQTTAIRRTLLGPYSITAPLQSRYQNRLFKIP